MAIIIGIDTGGTFTDAVVFDATRRAVIAKAKALTTRGDLAIGVGEALAAALDATGADPTTRRRVALVAVSTTLATNAIVEGQGGPIAILLAGFDDAMVQRAGFAAALPGTPVLRLAGGHDHAGEPLAPLDLDTAEAFVRRHGPAVEAFAVASLYSVRNPDHERRLGALAADLTGRPVTLSSELASDLDAPRRALTAALNARLVGRITGLVAAIRRAMHGLGLDVPLTMVRGDGTMARAEAVLARPIETILSGPAASVIGAKLQSGLEDFVMSDVGGTTTDIAVLERGWPRLDPAGAEVGGFRTLVRAVEMRTYGLGGDSEVALEADGSIRIGPRRVIPVSLLALRHPAILARLEAGLADPDAAGQAWRFVVRPFGAGRPANDEVSDPGLDARDTALLARVAAGPVLFAEIARDPRDRRRAERLVAAGRLQMSGFTFSDAAHVGGGQATWSRPAALLAARLLAGARRMGPAGDAEAEAFAAEVASRFAARSTRAILETVSRRAPGAPDALFDAVADGAPQRHGLRITLAPAVPVVAVGGPARLVYPEVGRRFGTEIRFTADGEVANALGAAAAIVRGRAIVEVSTRPGGGWRIHHEAGIVDRDDGDAAIRTAVELAEAAARDRAGRFGAAEGGGVGIETRVQRVDLPGTTGGQGLVSATVTAEATGRATLDREELSDKPAFAT